MITIYNEANNTITFRRTYRKNRHGKDFLQPKVYASTVSFTVSDEFRLHIHFDNGGYTVDRDNLFDHHSIVYGILNRLYGDLAVYHHSQSMWIGEKWFIRKYTKIVSKVVATALRKVKEPFLQDKVFLLLRRHHGLRCTNDSGELFQLIAADDWLYNEYMTTLSFPYFCDQFVTFDVRTQHYLLRGRVAVYSLEEKHLIIGLRNYVELLGDLEMPNPKYREFVRTKTPKLRDKSLIKEMIPAVMDDPLFNEISGLDKAIYLQFTGHKNIPKRLRELWFKSTLEERVRCVSLFAQRFDKLTHRAKVSQRYFIGSFIDDYLRCLNQMKHLWVRESDTLWEVTQRCFTTITFLAQAYDYRDEPIFLDAWGKSVFTGDRSAKVNAQMQMIAYLEQEPRVMTPGLEVPLRKSHTIQMVLNLLEFVPIWEIIRVHVCYTGIEINVRIGYVDHSSDMRVIN